MEKLDKEESNTVNSARSVVPAKPRRDMKHKDEKAKPVIKVSLQQVPVRLRQL